ncbi:hypothetical protein MtrunA17_Chr8g0348111 [Medicago truncatula]|uniref:Uncharacterized protein n=1 Tax=Medicago truncatula TaxID=3880 RepID=A0A396GEQ5_MEDTR|nr:hypothetical protein MtrunA17_Chr8g0348111 [Medicago truncatula]
MLQALLLLGLQTYTIFVHSTHRFHFSIRCFSFVYSIQKSMLLIFLCYTY